MLQLMIFVDIYEFGKKYPMYLKNDLINKLGKRFAELIIQMLMNWKYTPKSKNSDFVRFMWNENY